MPHMKTRPVSYNKYLFEKKRYWNKHDSISLPAVWKEANIKLPLPLKDEDK